MQKTGLTTVEVEESRKKYGNNIMFNEKKKNFFGTVIHVLLEPMFLLLIAAAVVYFVLGEARDGAIMLVFVVVIILIDIIQEWKTDKTLKKLKDLSAPTVRVIRDGKETAILCSELVVGDIAIISEGDKVPADGYILECNDLSVNESILTGEAEAVLKHEKEEGHDNDGYWKKDYCFSGTLVVHGSAYIEIEKIGKDTEYGKIGNSILKQPVTKTPLQKQTGKLVKVCTAIAGVLFVLVVLINFFNLANKVFAERLTDSILSGITLAMAMIPEEFPVILTVFLSMGAWRLAKKQSLIRKLPSVETLGAVSVLCVDKTGTVTKNEMTVSDICIFNKTKKEEFLSILGRACETEAYDKMEKAILNYCENNGIKKEELFKRKLLKEYPFTNKSKMMGHVWEEDEKACVCIKGSAESVINISSVNEVEKQTIQQRAAELSKKGKRVIAVACTYLNKEKVPNELEDITAEFCGLVALVDPPREGIEQNVEALTKAGIRLVMITGDYGITASSIAEQIKIPDSDKFITGEEIDNMNDEKLMECVKTVNIYSRVMPEHKMRIIEALQRNGEIVAMTGDGVNDAPALKKADIGIAMGKKGSEVSREAADLILLDDNFSTIVDTVKDGRKIYSNIKKAIGYIFSIHIPIALASLLTPFMNIPQEAYMLLPLHVVLLELLIDPTSAIVLERQPSEKDVMKKPPRKKDENILTKKTFAKSIIQGLVIFLFAFGAFLLMKPSDIYSATKGRSLALVIIMFANLFLVLVNSSDKDSILFSLKKLIKDKVFLGIIIFTLVLMIVMLYTPLNNVLKLCALNCFEMTIGFCLAAVSVLWYEVVKAINRNRLKKRAMIDKNSSVN